MNDFLIESARDCIKRSVFTGRFYLTLLSGCFCIGMSLVNYRGLVNLFMLLFGVMLVDVNLLQMRYWFRIKKNDCVLTPVQVIQKVEYDACRSAHYKYNNSYLVLRKSNGETMDRKMSLMRRFYKINEGDSAVIISAGGFNKFFTFDELGINDVLSNEVITEQHIDMNVLTPIGKGVLKNAVIMNNDSVYDCTVYIDKKPCNLSGDIIWLLASHQ